MDFAESYNHDIFRVYVPKKVTIGVMHPDPVVETSFFLSFSTTHPQSSRRCVAARRVLRPPSPAARDRRGPVIESSAGNGHLRLAAPPAVQPARLPLRLPARRRRRRWKGTAARWNHRGELDGVGTANGLEGRGRKQAIWISESGDLVYDCRRDLDDIGFSEIPVGSTRGR